MILRNPARTDGRRLSAKSIHRVMNYLVPGPGDKPQELMRRLESTADTRARGRWWLTASDVPAARNARPASPPARPGWRPRRRSCGPGTSVAAGPWYRRSPGWASVRLDRSMWRGPISLTSIVGPRAAAGRAGWRRTGRARKSAIADRPRRRRPSSRRNDRLPAAHRGKRCPTEGFDHPLGGQRAATG